MNKVITINLNGVAYQLEEGGFDALRAYLDNAARRLEGNPDQDEIITDIEQSIADKFRALLVAHKTVVNTKEVTGVLDEMGPVEDGSPASAASEAHTAGPGGVKPGRPDAEPQMGGVRRLYRIREGSMLAGVCNGLAIYTNVDVTFIRLAFALLMLLWGTGVLVYVVMAIIVPEAKTAAEKAAASGMAATTQEFIRRARAGYYEGMRSFHDKSARRAWKRKFKHDMRGWRQQARDQSYAWSGWSPQWQQGPGQYPPPASGPMFFAPLFSILMFGAVICLVYAIYSVATSGHVFGLTLPSGMPAWVGILLAVFVYKLVVWPIKSARYACYYPGGYHPRHGGPFGGFLGGIAGVFFLAFGIWMLNRHVPEFHEWLVQVPGLLHKFADTVQGWFTAKA